MGCGAGARGPEGTAMAEGVQPRPNVFHKGQEDAANSEEAPFRQKLFIRISRNKSAPLRATRQQFPTQCEIADSSTTPGAHTGGRWCGREGWWEGSPMNGFVAAE